VFCASVIDAGDTKKSFDLTGELTKLNESGGSDRLSFVEQLENALRTPVNLRYDHAHTQSHPRTRAKDRSSKNTPTNCEGLRYRTPR
jgi:hypothetical protein